MYIVAQYYFVDMSKERGILLVELDVITFTVTYIITRILLEFLLQQCDCPGMECNHKWLGGIDMYCLTRGSDILCHSLAPG